jgi:DNA-binding LytR/AlgR family response regulator
MSRLLNWGAAAAVYAWLASVCGATVLLWHGRRVSGQEADLASIAVWQALVYGLWAPVWLALAFLLRRTGLGGRGLAAAAAFALPALAFHAFAASTLDLHWSPRMAALGYPVALAERLPVDLLFYLAIAGATWAAAAHRQSRRLMDALAVAKAATPSEGAEESLLVSAGSRRIPVPVEAVEWLGAAGNYVVVNWDGREGLVRSSLQELEQRLDPARFARIHRSTLANLARVDSASSLSDGSWRLTMRSGAELVASRTYRDRILERLGRR